MDWNPGDKYTLYLNRIEDLLTDERRTVRDVYYALEARGFPDELADYGFEFEYRYVKRAVKKGRRAGYIDPSLIVDESRVTANTPTSGDDPPTSYAERIAGMPDHYFEDPWADQDTHVEVWLEKQSLASVFRPICDDWNVRLEATRGDWSDSKVFEAASRLVDRLQDGDDVRILYFGDFNPSGLHAPVAVQNTMRHYGLPIRPEDGGPDQDYFDIWPFWAGDDDRDDNAATFANADGSIKFERLALTIEQVEEYDLPQNPTPSSTDKDKELRDRFMRLASNGNDVNIELNALKEYHRDDLEDLVHDGIDKHVDDVAWEESHDRTRRRKEQLHEAVDVDFDTLPE